LIWHDFSSSLSLKPGFFFLQNQVSSCIYRSCQDQTLKVSENLQGFCVRFSKIAAPCGGLRRRKGRGDVI